MPYTAAMRLRCLLHELGREHFTQDVVTLTPLLANRLKDDLGCFCRCLGKRTILGLASGKRLRDLVRGQQRCVIHCWDDLAAWEARLSLVMPTTRVALVLEQPIMPLESKQWQRLRWLASEALVVVCSSGSVHRRLCGNVGDEEHVRLIEPVVDFDRMDGSRRQALRNQLGLTDSQLLVALPQSIDPACRAHYTGLWAAAILQRVYNDMKVAAPADHAAMEQLHRICVRFGCGHMLLRPACRLRQPELILAADLFLAVEPKPLHPQSLAYAMAGGAAIIATANAERPDWLDEQTCLLVEKRQPRRLASAMLRLWEDDQLRGRLSQTAQARAREIFMPAKIVGRYVRLYSRLVEDTALGSLRRITTGRSISHLLGAGY